MAKWTINDIEQLISLVRQNETLYNQNLKGHFNRDILDSLWYDISFQLNKTETDCRKKWRNLRIVFRRQLKYAKLVEQGSYSNKDIKKWAWMEGMSFLQPHFQERDSFLKQHIQERDTSEKVSSLAELKPELSANYIYEDQKDMELSDLSAPSSLSMSDEYASQSSISHPTTSSPRLDKSTDGDIRNMVNEEFLRFLVDRNSCSKMKSENVHPDELFLLSLLPDIKMLSPRQKGLFKLKVQQLLQGMLFPE